MFYNEAFYINEPHKHFRLDNNYKHFVSYASSYNGDDITIFGTDDDKEMLDWLKWNDSISFNFENHSDFYLYIFNEEIIHRDELEEAIKALRGED